MNTHPVYQTAKRIFDVREITLQVSQVELRAIETKEVQFHTDVVDGMMDFNGVRIRRSSAAEDLIRSRLLGRPTETGDERSDNTQINGQFHRRLTLNEVVEMWHYMHNLKFVYPEDIVTTKNVLQEYLRNVDRADYDLFNYRHPPTEDIDKIVATINAVSDAADRVTNAGAVGNDNWSRFLKAVGGVITLTSQTNTLKDHRPPQTASVTENDEIDIPSPFGFLGGPKQ